MKSQFIMQDRNGHASLPPHGGRGLKSTGAALTADGELSSSARRKGIEIIMRIFRRLDGVSLPPHGGRGLKYAEYYASGGQTMSSSARRKGIEILL